MHPAQATTRVLTVIELIRKVKTPQSASAIAAACIGAHRRSPCRTLGVKRSTTSPLCSSHVATPHDDSKLDAGLSFYFRQTTDPTPAATTPLTSRPSRTHPSCRESGTKRPWVRTPPRRPGHQRPRYQAWCRAFDCHTAANYSSSQSSRLSPRRYKPVTSAFVHGLPGR